MDVTWFGEQSRVFGISNIYVIPICAIILVYTTTTVWFRLFVDCLYISEWFFVITLKYT